MSRFYRISLLGAGLTIFFILLVGCSSRTPGTSPTRTPTIYLIMPSASILTTTPSTQLASVIPTFSPTISPDPTRLAISATSLPDHLVTETTIPTPLNLIENSCVRITQSTSPALSGSLILRTSKQNTQSSSYILDLKTGNEITIGNVSNEVISPDNSHLAFWDIDAKALIVTDVSGKRVKAIPDPDERLSPAGWLDNQRLMIDHRRTDWGSSYNVASLIILNPFTGEQHEWLPEYPNYNDHYNEVNWRINSRLIFNPSLTRLIYPAWEDDLPVILWDAESNNEVTRIHHGDSFTAPSWSPDGTRFVISAPPKISSNGNSYINIDDGFPYVGGNDLFLVYQTGKIERLTYFTTIDQAWQFSYNWSPDGQWIAFSLQMGKLATAPSGQLAVVAVETGDVTNYCVDGNPIWSADGKYIVITQVDKDLLFQVFVVSLQGAQAWKIAENSAAIGWMTSP